METQTQTETIEATPEKVEAFTPYAFGSPLSEASLKLIRGKHNQVVRLPFGQVTIQNGRNVRDMADPVNVANVADLKALIADAGEVVNALQVVLVPDQEVQGKFRAVVRDGETRLRAVRALRETQGEAAWSELPVILKEEGTPEQETLAFLQNNSGKGLTMLEQAAILKRLRTHGYTYQAAADKLAISKANVIQWVKPLVYATQSMVDMVHLGTAPGGISATDLSKRISSAIEKAATDEEIGAAVALLEKTLIQRRKMLEARGIKQSSGSVAVTDQELAEGSEGKPKTAHALWVEDYGTPSKDAQRALVDAARATLALMVPASRFSEARQPLVNCLESLSIDLVKKVRETAQKEAQAAKNGAQAPAEAPATK